MEELEKSILINELFDIYGDLLAKSQHKMIYLYYTLDLSLSEIALQEGVSRNAVHDAIKKGVDSLYLFEKKLCILENKNKFNKKLKKLEKILDKSNYQKVKEIFEEEE